MLSTQDWFGNMVVTKCYTLVCLWFLVMGVGFAVLRNILLVLHVKESLVVLMNFVILVIFLKMSNLISFDLWHVKNPLESILDFILFLAFRKSQNGSEDSHWVNPLRQNVESRMPWRLKNLKRWIREFLYFFCFVFYFVMGISPLVVVLLYWILFCMFRLGQVRKRKWVETQKIGGSKTRSRRTGPEFGPKSPSLSPTLLFVYVLLLKCR